MKMVADRILYLILQALVGLMRYIQWIFAKPFEKRIQRAVQETLISAGITVNGKEPYDIRVHNSQLYLRLFVEGSIGLGEAYMEGWWDCDRLDLYFERVINSGIHGKMSNRLDDFLRFLQIFHFLNAHTREEPLKVIKKHYDLGNELFQSFLGPSMVYSCAYWRSAKNLTEAQQNKMDVIARKLKLEPGMRVLDLGCGWGTLAKYLAETYRVRVVGVTLSPKAAKYGQEICKGLDVEIRVQDYRDVNEKFDRIVCIEMLLHVERKNRRAFFQLVHRCLPKHGILVVQVVGVDNDTVTQSDPWARKYIFPNYMLTNHKELPRAIDNLFTIEDWQNFGADFAKTYEAWRENFVKNWSRIKHLFVEPKKAFRMWSYYFSSSEGAFRTRQYHVWHIVLAKNGIPGGYEHVC